MKKRRILNILLTVIICSAGCGKVENEIENNKDIIVEDETNTIEIERRNNEMSDIEYMTGKYGFEEEELEGIDLARLINDYRLKDLDYTEEEVRQIIASEGDRYFDDGSTRIYGIFAEKGNSLKESDEIKKIGLYINAGTDTQRVVFDLERNVYYLNDTTESTLSEDNAKKLLDIPAKYDLYSWQGHYEGDEDKNTGSYEWRLVFECGDGNYAVYDGYTTDMSHIPENYYEVKNEIMSCCGH